jgi:hypothetical protein
MMNRNLEVYTFSSDDYDLEEKKFNLGYTKTIKILIWNNGQIECLYRKSFIKTVADCQSLINEVSYDNLVLFRSFVK